MEFGPRRNPTKNGKKAGIITALLAVAGAVQALIAGSYGKRSHSSGGDVGSIGTMLIFGIIIGVPIVVFIATRFVRNSGDDDTNTSNTTDTPMGVNAIDSNYTADEADDDQNRRTVVFGLAAALIAIGLALFAYASTAHAQGAADRGTIYLRNGADTVVVDHFARTGDTLRGRAQLKGQGPVDYLVVLAAGNIVRTLTYDIYAPAAKDGDTPATHVVFRMLGDSAVAQTATGPHTVQTKPGAIPMMGNLLALTELYTRRAKSSGGTLEMPWLAVAGGTTIMVTAKPIGSDSMSLMIGEQEQRFRIDAVGRILGGSVIGRKLEFLRGGPETAGTFRTPPVIAPVAPPDYSAPAGAPYTAEEVRIAGPAGTLGGTLTIPKNARGRLPAVVTITGSGQQDRDEYVPLAGGVRLFKELSDTLSRRGIAVLRLDDRGLGASTGDPTVATSADFADDIRAAVAYLRTRADIDPNRIALAGHSEGGMIGPMIAATDPRIRAVVTLAGPAIKGIDISISQNKNLLDHNPSLSATQKDSILRAARKTLENQTVPWLKFFMAYDPAPVLRQVKAAVLVVQGETDQQITPNQAEMLAGYVRSGGNKDVTVRMFPATNHLFIPDSDGDPAKYNELKSNKIRPEVLGAVADWLVVKLR